MHGLDQLYWRWAATERHESDLVPAIESPSQGPGTSSAQSTNEAATPPSPQPEVSLGESSNSSGPEIAILEASGGATSESAHDLRGVEEPRLDPVEALSSSDHELEERKVDEADQLPPRRLNYDGIDLVREQNQWPPAGFSDMDHTEYNPFALTNNNEYGLPAADDAFSNSLDGAGGAENWTHNFDVLDCEASFPMGYPEDSPAYESPVDVGVKETGENPGMREGESTDSGKRDGFIIIAESSN